MSEFKEFERGLWVVFDTSRPYCRLLPPCLMKFIEEVDGDAMVETQGQWSLVSLAALKIASEEEIAAGHRIDKVVPVYADVKFPYSVLTGEQVGAVMNVTHFGCDLGDDFPIENHISPNCKVRGG